MKSTGIFFAALFGFSTLVSIGMLVTATMKPELFGAKHAAADTLQTHGKKDSSAAAQASLAQAGGHADSAAAIVPGTVQAAGAGTDHSAPEKKEPAAAAQAAQSLPDGKAKEEDLQNLVKLYEAMKPEDAAKILGKLQDKEIRTIILHTKKKQAAKILSYFDANRAAQILAQ